MGNGLAIAPDAADVAAFDHADLRNNLAQGGFSAPERSLSSRSSPFNWSQLKTESIY
jgi:hypothetical protein